MTTQPAAPPAAQLVARARKARGLTPEQAAAQLPANIAIKGGRWRQIEQGYIAKRGERVPTEADATQLAHMAAVVGVAPHQLDEIESTDAADILREIVRQAEGGGQDLLARLGLESDRQFMAALNRLPPEYHRAALEQVAELRRRIEREEQHARADITRYVNTLAEATGDESP